MRDIDMENRSRGALCRSMLEQWIPAARMDIHDGGDVACYSSGDTGNWAVQANLCAFAAFAVLATEEEYEEKRTGISREELREVALKLLRYTLRTHLSGDRDSFTGRKWGNSWISILGLERMMHAFEAIESFCSDEDRELFRRVLLSEAEFMLNHYKVAAGIDACRGPNKPESNVWNGAFLHRLLLYYPDIPDRERILEKANSFLYNAISVPADSRDCSPASGRRVCDWHIGSNFTENFGLHHHKYLNVGYMAICLSNIALLHFSFRRRGVKAPEALYFHAEELWKRVKYFTCPDGRLWRIGGDMRVRYCYCQDYMIPVWLWAADYLKDADAGAMENRWLETVQKEQAVNGNGSFLGKRLADMRKMEPVYFHRLEGDRAVSLSYDLYYTRHCLCFSNCSVSGLPFDSWKDDFHGAVTVRSSNRMASFVREARTRPTLLVASPEHSDMLEWHWNGVGMVEGFGIRVYTGMEREAYSIFPGGFLSCVRWHWVSDEQATEGVGAELAAVSDFAAAALPDGVTTLLLERTRTPNLVYLRSIKGLHWNLPNDVFNGELRTLRCGEHTFRLRGIPEEEEIIPLPGRNFLFDDCFAVRQVYGAAPVIVRPARRQIAIHDPYRMCYGHSGGNLHALELCAPYRQGPVVCRPGECLYDNAWCISTDGDVIRLLSGEVPCNSEIRVVQAEGKDRRRYIFVANFGDEPELFRWPGEGRVVSESGSPTSPGRKGGKNLAEAVNLSGEPFVRFPEVYEERGASVLEVAEEDRVPVAGCWEIKPGKAVLIQENSKNEKGKSDR